MYKSLWKKVLVLGIILLFFGSSVLSSMSSSVMKIKNRKAILDSEDWTLTEIVSLESDGNSFHPSLDIDSNGTLHIAWKDSEGYYDNIVYKYKPNGGSWSDPEIVYSHYEICSSSPSLMVDSSGTVHVAWDASKHDYVSGNVYSYIFYRYKPSGGSWSNCEIIQEFFSSTDDPVYLTHPDLAVDSNGTVHVAWSKHYFPDETYIYYGYKPYGETWDYTTIFFDPSSSYLYVSLSVKSGGTVHVAWGAAANYCNSSDDWDIFYRYKPSGGSWSPLEVISTESNIWSSFPFLAVDPSGTVHLIWMEYYDQINSWIVYKYKPNNGNWSDLETVSYGSYVDYYYKHISLATEYDGIVHAAWYGVIFRSSQPDLYDVYYAKRPSGGGWTNAELVSTDTVNSYPASYTTNPPGLVINNGIVHIAWLEGSTYQGSGDDIDIFYKNNSGTSGNQPPVADFTWTPQYPEPDETVSFDASASYDPDGTIELYEWDWDNDGVYDESHTSPTATHSWSEEGSYLVTLRVTDNDSATDTETKTVYVGGQCFYPPYYDDGTESYGAKLSDVLNAPFLTLLFNYNSIRFFCGKNSKTNMLLSLEIINKIRHRYTGSAAPLSETMKAGADATTGNMWVEASAISNLPFSKQKANAGAYIDGVSPESRYFTVPLDGTYKVTFSIKLIDGIAQIQCDIIDAGYAYGECVVAAALFREGENEFFTSTGIHTFFDNTDRGWSPYFHNFNNDPKDYSGTITTELSAGTNYFFRCALGTMHETYKESFDTISQVISSGRINIYLTSVCVEPVKMP